MSWHAWWKSLIGKILQWTKWNSTTVPETYIHVEELERRVFMSASPLGLFVPEGNMPTAFDPDAVDFNDPIWAWQSDGSDGSVGSVGSSFFGSDGSVGSGSDGSLRRELVLLDTGIHNFQQVLDDLSANNDPTGNWKFS
jgi:hypothetical protein